MLNAFRTALAPAGLNLLGVANAAAWDATQEVSRRTAALCPGARSIIVIGNGGAGLWPALLSDIHADQCHLTEQAHPLDAFVQRQLALLEPLLGHVGHRWFFAAAEADIHIDFRVLGKLAGLGADSRLGLLLSSEYGPWVGLRAACFLDVELEPTEPARDSCAGCPAPCISACPGSAFASGRWAVDPCVAFHSESAVCESGCAARSACPVGDEHRYLEEQMVYHYNRTLGRELLRSRLGISGDGHEGVGPHWDGW